MNAMLTRSCFSARRQGRRAPSPGDRPPLADNRSGPTARAYRVPLGAVSQAPAAASMASMPMRSVGLMTGANSGE